MNCANCGRTLAADQQFCPGCGTPVSAAATPPAAAPHPAAAAPAPNTGAIPKKGRGCLRSCLTVFLLGFLGLVCVVLGGYLAFSRGLISRAQIEGAFTPAPGTVSVVNLSDGSMEVQFYRQDQESGEFENSEYRFDLAPFDSWETSGFRAGRPYRVAFRFGNGRSESQCTLHMESGDRYTFVALSDEIAVDREDAEVTSAGDLQIDHSPFCGN